jgi:pterin-4a-carbinolamine dehydratase
MTMQWSPAGGILTSAEVRRALESRPGWHRRRDGLTREVRCRDFASARGLAERLADEATYYGRHPEIVIHDDGRMLISLAGPNHAGVTVADLALADEVDRVVAAERA